MSNDNIIKKTLRYPGYVPQVISQAVTSSMLRLNRGSTIILDCTDVATENDPGAAYMLFNMAHNTKACLRLVYDSEVAENVPMPDEPIRYNFTIQMEHNKSHLILGSYNIAESFLDDDDSVVDDIIDIIASESEPYTFRDDEGFILLTARSNFSFYRYRHCKSKHRLSDEYDNYELKKSRYGSDVFMEVCGVDSRNDILLSLVTMINLACTRVDVRHEVFSDLLCDDADSGNSFTHMMDFLGNPDTHEIKAAAHACGFNDKMQAEILSRVCCSMYPNPNTSNKMRSRFNSDMTLVQPFMGA